jgi:hypothetical protein
VKLSFENNQWKRGKMKLIYPEFEPFELNMKEVYEKNKVLEAENAILNYKLNVALDMVKFSLN